jgi:hypothetical protein
VKPEKWDGTESNRRHEDFQSSALPTELPSLLVLGLKKIETRVDKYHNSQIESTKYPILIQLGNHEVGNKISGYFLILV